MIRSACEFLGKRCGADEETMIHVHDGVRAVCDEITSKTNALHVDLLQMQHLDHIQFQGPGNNQAITHTHDGTQTNVERPLTSTVEEDDDDHQDETRNGPSTTGYGQPDIHDRQPRPAGIKRRCARRIRDKIIEMTGMRGKITSFQDGSKQGRSHGHSTRGYADQLAAQQALSHLL